MYQGIWHDSWASWSLNWVLFLLLLALGSQCDPYTNIYTNITGLYCPAKQKNKWFVVCVWCLTSTGRKMKLTPSCQSWSFKYFFLKMGVNFPVWTINRVSIVIGHPRGGGVTPLYQEYRYVVPQRVWFLSHFGLKTGLDFEHFGLKLGMVIWGTFTKASKIIFLPSNWGE